MTVVIDGMDADLPNDIQQLKALLLQTQATLAVKETERKKRLELANEACRLPLPGGPWIAR